MADKGEILVHTCCGVCFEAVIGALFDEGYGVTAFFYNPNVHPYREFAKRLRAAETAAEAHKVRLLADKEYGLQLYLDRILSAAGGRCEACYAVRLEEAARTAAREGIGAFTTTLLASCHQKHEAVAEAGRTAAAREGIECVYRDWRGRLALGIEQAKRRSLYRQQYCGCIWSEYERFGRDVEGAGE